VVVRAWGKDTPSEPESLGGDNEEEDEHEEEGEVTPHPNSTSREALPLLGDIFSRQARIAIGTRRSRRPRTETRPSIDSPPHHHLTLVSPDLHGMIVCGGDENNSVNWGFAGPTVLAGC
jgi:hypothetical protein